MKFDSLIVLNFKLESLVGNLEDEKLIETKKEFGDGANLMTRKGIYPYDWVNGIEKFSEEKLPPKEKLFSKLNDCGVSDEDYEVKLELLTDVEILLLIEKAIRGGVSMISNRFGKANNKFMGEKFDPSHPSKFITYLDANNLYGWAMMKPLPVGDFEWMNEEELENWKNIPCILEVDLEYPRELRVLHNDYPVAPERLRINNVEKLIPNLWDKKKYIVHHENLKLYEELGLKIKKIHRGIKFREEPWMKSYIELNTRLRTEAKNDFEKDSFKLMNNSVFGKTMENIRNRVDVKLVSD